MKKLDGMKVAILVADGFEQSEMALPRKALDRAGATTVIVSPCHGKVRSWKDMDWGSKYGVDQELAGASPRDFDALHLPGGVINPDTLRLNPQAVAFVRHFVQEGKPISAICHGPWTLINAQGVKGKKMTSWPSLQIDLTNAGATWIDQEVVVDGNLVTSRKPDDIPAFNEAIIKLFESHKN